MRHQPDSNRMATSLASGLAGAVALTAIHETVRRMTPDAPRMDIYGRRALARGMESVGMAPPSAPAMQGIALAGDLLSNGLYYALVGARRRKSSLMRGAALGVLAGVGAVVLPPVLGLGKWPSNATRRTQWMTIGWYTAGGIAAAVVNHVLAPDDD